MQQLQELRALAASLGFCVVKKSKFVKSIGQSIATRMRTREGNHIYQSGKVSIPGIPRDFAEELFLGAYQAVNNSHKITWQLRSLSEVSQTLSGFLAATDFVTAGLTRAIRRDSEAVIRLLATLMAPAEITHTASRSGDMLHMNFLYILTDHAGEVHWPKDADRREMQVSADEAGGAVGCSDDRKRRPPSLGGVVEAAGEGGGGINCGCARGELALRRSHRQSQERQVRSRGDCSGAPRSSSGALGGVSSNVGSVAHDGNPGRSGGDVGEAIEAEAYRGLPPVADAEEGASARVSEAERRCQRRACLEARAHLRSLQKDLGTLQLKLRLAESQCELLVEGRVRALRTDYESVVRERDDLAHQRDAAMRQTRYWRRLSESSEEELLSALDTIATLSSELSQRRRARHPAALLLSPA